MAGKGSADNEDKIHDRHAQHQNLHHYVFIVGASLIAAGSEFLLVWPENHHYALLCLAATLSLVTIYETHVVLGWDINWIIAAVFFWITGAQIIYGVVGPNLPSEDDARLNRLETAVDKLAAAPPAPPVRSTVVAKVPGIHIDEDDRALVKRLVKGAQWPITVVTLNEPEPHLYGMEIRDALNNAGFDTSIENWDGAIPPETGVVFCENADMDHRIYDALHRANVATRYISLADHRPDFCDIPGVEAPVEKLIGGLTLGLVTPEKVGRLIPRGTLAGQRGPRIFVGEAPE